MRSELSLSKIQTLVDARLLHDFAIDSRAKIFRGHTSLTLQFLPARFPPPPQFFVPAKLARHLKQVKYNRKIKLDNQN